MVVQKKVTQENRTKEEKGTDALLKEFIIGE